MTDGAIERDSCLSLVAPVHPGRRDMDDQPYWLVLTAVSVRQQTFEGPTTYLIERLSLQTGGRRALDELVDRLLRDIAARADAE